VIDVDAAAVALAQSHPALVTAVGGRIYGGDAPPTDYSSAGGAVCLKSRGGPTRYDPLLTVSIQVKCYGPTATAAWQVYATTFNALHETAGGSVVFSQSETLGQQLTEPSTGRIFILAYFRMEMRP
jgi:hypothetical protein